jgi:hypothetical protein
MFNFAEVLTLIASLITLFQISLASKTSTANHLITLRFQTYSEFLDLYSVRKNTSTPVEELIEKYNQVLVLTPDKYYQQITAFYKSYIENLSVNTEFCPQEVISLRKEVIVIFNQLLLKNDLSYGKKSFLKHRNQGNKQ